jgi:hypothetical protein
LISTETDLFAVEPEMSYVSEQVAVAAPDYWHPKAVVAKAKKESAASPAAKKEEKK